MGCVFSSDRELLSSIPVQWLQLFYALQLTGDDVLRLHRVFYSFKVSICSESEDPLRRTINISDLSLYLNINHTVFNEKSLGILDRTQSGMVDFRQFVLVSWNLSTLSYDGMCQFVYDLYHSSSASEDQQFMLLPEITLLIQDLHDKQLETSPNLQEIMSEARRVDEKQHIDYSSYKALCNQYKLILFPAFLLQERLRSTLFWGRSETKLLGSRTALALACKSESLKRSAADGYTPLMELLLMYASSSSSLDNGSILKGLIRKDRRGDRAGDDYWSDAKTDERGSSSPKETRSRNGKSASTGRRSLSDDDGVTTVSGSSPSSSVSMSKKMLRVARESLFGGSKPSSPSGRGNKKRFGSNRKNTGEITAKSSSLDSSSSSSSTVEAKKKGGRSLQKRFQQLRQSIVEGVGRRQREFDSLDDADYHPSGEGVVDDDRGPPLQSKKAQSRWRPSLILLRVQKRADLYSATTGMDEDVVDQKKSRGRRIHPTA